MSRNGIVGIDHTLIGVRDLEAARMAWTRLGFTLSPRGRHIGWGTANYCVMFERDYIELLGIVDPRQFTNRLNEFLEGREGLMGLAFATNDAVEAAHELAALGLHPGEPRDLARQLELPEGTVLPRFKLLFLPAEETPALSTFLCQHLTPDLLRHPLWLEHPNGAVGLKRVMVVVDETAPLVAPYERLFGPAALTPTDNVLTIHAGRHGIVFATPDDVAAMHPEIELPDWPRPFIASMTVAVADRERAKDHLIDWQIDHLEAADGSLLVPPEQANGTLIEFVAA